MAVARRSLGVGVAVVVVVLACGRERKVGISVDRRDNSDASFVRRDTNRTLGPGDVRILNTDSSFEIAVIGDSIVTGFGPMVIAELKKNTDTSAVEGSGFGASIEKLVKSTVATAMDREIKYPVANVQRVAYVDGRMEFYWKDGSRMKLFDKTKENDKPVSSTFSSEDANRFIAAFNSRKASLGR